MTTSEMVEIIVQPTRESDQQGVIRAGRKGTGAVFETRIKGQRGAVRVEQFTLSNHMREQLIRTLGGTP